MRSDVIKWFQTENRPSWQKKLDRKKFFPIGFGLFPTKVIFFFFNTFLKLKTANFCMLVRPAPKQWPLLVGNLYPILNLLTCSDHFLFRGQQGATAAAVAGWLSPANTACSFNSFYVSWLRSMLGFACLFVRFKSSLPIFIRCCFRSPHCQLPESWHLWFLIGFFPQMCFWFLFTLPTMLNCITDYPAGCLHCNCVSLKINSLKTTNIYFSPSNRNL